MSRTQIMCHKPGKTLIPIDKPQLYFVDVVSASTRYAHRDDAFSAAHCLECAPPKRINLRTCTAWEIWYHRLTNRPRTLGRPSRAGVRVGWIIQPTCTRWSAQGTRVLDREADWSTAPMKGNFDEFRNQWLTHWHSYQIADLFNSRNITGLNH